MTRRRVWAMVVSTLTTIALGSVSAHASVTASPPLRTPAEREPGGEAAQVPQIPATFYGSATVDGKAPPEGSLVRGLINGLDCTQPGAAGTITAEGVGAYVIHVMHESQLPGCGKQGATVTFTVAGRAAGQSAPWAQGPQPLGLNAGAGEVQPLPSTVPVPTQAVATTPTAPGSVPTTGDVRVSGAQSTPRPPGISQGRPEADGAGPGSAGFAIIALFLLALLAGAAGVIVSRRKPPAG